MSVTVCHCRRPDSESDRRNRDCQWHGPGPSHGDDSDSADDREPDSEYWLELWTDKTRARGDSDSEPASLSDASGSSQAAADCHP